MGLDLLVIKYLILPEPQACQNCLPSDMTLLKEDTVRAGKAIRGVATGKIIEMLKERFQNLDEEIFSLMK